MDKSRQSEKLLRNQQFLFTPKFNVTPPPAQAPPKALYYPLESGRHYKHEYSSLYLSQMKPLLIPCDMGIPVEELILYSKEYNSSAADKLHPDDEALLEESMMIQKEGRPKE